MASTSFGGARAKFFKNNWILWQQIWTKTALLWAKKKSGQKNRKIEKCSIFWFFGTPPSFAGARGDFLQFSQKMKKCDLSKVLYCGGGEKNVEKQKLYFFSCFHNALIWGRWKFFFSFFLKMMKNNLAKVFYCGQSEKVVKKS